MSWKTLKLGDVCDVRDGTHDSPKYVENGFPLITSKNLVAGFIDKSNASYISETDYNNICKRSKVDFGDILMPMIGTIGNPVIVNEASPAFAIKNVALIKFNKESPDRFFIKSVLNSQLFHSYIEQVSRGGTQKFLSLGDIRKFPFPLPPLSEQKRIAAILDKANEIRRKREGAIAKLDQLAQSIFVEMFGDIVINDKGWKVLRFGEVGTLDRGISKHRPRNAPELLGGIYPIVQTGEVSNSDGYIRSYNNTYSEVGLRQSKMWPAGTLCITIAANIAKTGILTFDACFPDSVVGFCSDNAATVQYVRVWLSFLQKTLEDNAPECAQKNINLAILRELKIPFPPIALQEEFSKRLMLIQSIKSKYVDVLNKQNSLFASLQHQAFTGNL